jgi:hypothetical protein
MNMDDNLNRVFANVEQIIITLLKENRYSYQLLRSVKLISKEINIPLDKLNYSVSSLLLLDNYLDGLIDKKAASLEFYLSITIYFSQALILSCNGIWSVKAEAFLSAEEVLSRGEELWIYYLHMIVYGSSFIIHPQCITMNNMLNKKSNLKREAVKLISGTKIHPSKFEEEYCCNRYYNRYNLAGLDSLIAEGKDFNSEISLLILSLSNTLNIPLNKLNKSVNSLKLIDESIRTDARNMSYDTDNFDENSFLSLLVYVGEVIIKAIDGKWKVNPERIHITGHGPQYHWNLRILNSEGRVLKDFIDNICHHISIHSYMGCRIKKQVERYIAADKKQDEYTWYDLKPSSKKRIWKTELTNSWGNSVGLNEEVGNLSDLIIPTPGY